MHGKTAQLKSTFINRRLKYPGLAWIFYTIRFFTQNRQQRLRQNELNEMYLERKRSRELVMKLAIKNVCAEWIRVNPERVHGCVHRVIPTIG